MKLFIVRDSSQALKLGFRPANNLLVFRSSMERLGYQHVGYIGIQPFVEKYRSLVFFTAP